MNLESVEGVLSTCVALVDAMWSNCICVIRVCACSTGIDVRAHCNSCIQCDGAKNGVDGAAEFLVLSVIAGKVCRQDDNQEECLLDLFLRVSKELNFMAS